MRVAKALAIASDNWLIKYSINIKNFMTWPISLYSCNFFYKVVLLLFKFKTTFDGKVWKLITSQHMSIWSLSHMLKIAHETCINNYLVVPDALILA